MDSFGFLALCESFSSKVAYPYQGRGRGGMARMDEQGKQIAEVVSPTIFMSIFMSAYLHAEGRYLL